MEGVFEHTRVTLCTFDTNKPTARTAETDMDKPMPSADKPPHPGKKAFSRSSICAAQTLRVPPMTQVTVLVR